MNIQGLQKLTLLDYPGQVACTVFTGGCNFRCPFCHNGQLAISPRLSPAITEEDLVAFLRKRSSILDGVCITGGEPLLQPDLEEVLKKIRDLGFLIKLDTNGSFPDRLSHLIRAGLVDYVAMDIKNSPKRYRETAGLPQEYDLQPVRESAACLMSGVIACEFRTTVVREYHRPQDIEDIGHWIRGAKRYFLQPFRDSENVINKGLHAPDAEEMAALLDRLLPLIPTAKIRGE
ncbi:MAG: anaerobic ribonucleoside-triphosphate reductase activating protein [Lachnospiraceae bacterium]|jgi:pyruvate formate lyase activating enzyme|nr:anaerobic ribonucleoside-triphosphate reductase activating protein [Lachnospiraceae bacterium]